MATVILLGNTAVVEVIKRPRRETDPPEMATAGTEIREGVEVEIVADRVTREDLGNRITNVEFPDDLDGDLGTQLGHVQHLWPYHSDADGPEWVETHDDLLAAAIARVFTTGSHECVIGRPEGWAEDE